MIGEISLGIKPKGSHLQRALACRALRGSTRETGCDADGLGGVRDREGHKAFREPLPSSAVCEAAHAALHDYAFVEQR